MRIILKPILIVSQKFLIGIVYRIDDFFFFFDLILTSIYD